MTLMTDILTVNIPKATMVIQPTSLSSDLIIQDRMKLCNFPINLTNKAIMIEEHINKPNTLQISSIVGVETDISDLVWFELS